MLVVSDEKYAYDLDRCVEFQKAGLFLVEDPERFLIFPFFSAARIGSIENAAGQAEVQ